MSRVVKSLLVGIALAAAGQTAASRQAASPAAQAAEPADADEILRRLVEDYRGDPMALDGVFGVKLGEAFWTVTVQRRERASPHGRLIDHAFGPHEVTLRRGMPAKPTWFFELASLDVLRAIDAGTINAGTAAMQSFESDRVGVEIRAMPGLVISAGEEADYYVALSHFFTRGVPEITRFGQGNSLATHGGRATALDMMKGLRVVYFVLPPEREANADPDLEAGQMPNLFIVTRGRGRALLGDRDIRIEAGMSIFVPPHVRHHFINDGSEPMEGVLVLYGDNSDFAHGTSYPAFQQDLNEFYRRYRFTKQQ